tara:strand:- start:110 stop:268 length:159 start_codon:yes stop_codon:yes gene_type:complete
LYVCLKEFFGKVSYTPFSGDGKGELPKDPTPLLVVTFIPRCGGGRIFASKSG